MSVEMSADNGHLAGPVNTSPFPLTELDKQILSLTDEQYEPHTWEQLKTIIAENRLETLKRWPSDLRRYIAWSSAIKQEYGSLMNYVMRERLHWQPSERSTAHTGPLFDVLSPEPFADSRDYEILPNDWPYGLDKGISHIIVWLKHRLEVDTVRGDLTGKSRAQAEAFIQGHFIKRLAKDYGGQDRVLWFKNWVSLQSVPGIDHVHVLLRDVPRDVIDKNWTNGRKALQEVLSSL